MAFDRSLPNDEIVPQIISEIVGLENDVVAISCVMVMRDGQIKTKVAFMEGTKLRYYGANATEVLSD